MAIGSLARLSGINYILDSKLSGPFLNAEGKPVPEPTVTINSTDLTYKKALEKTLKEHDLYLVEDPATSIAVIGWTNRIANQVDGNLLDSDTNQPVTVRFQDVPLDEALNNLIQRAHIHAALDPKVSAYVDPTNHKFHTPPAISVHWENVTARQALIALCENYNLTLVKDSMTGGVRIKPKD